ncbi:MAG: preprotein translocase subunit YajC [Actinomycetota bacterium]|jgi:preprotein translocase subunit YajC|nr:preprotein translocase subunit YajC [Actinomycetota bacterium]
MLFAATKSSGSPLIIIIYVIVFGGLYFFYLRPRSRKQKAARQQTRQVEIGDKARTIGGMIGTVVRRTEEAVTLRTESGHEIEFIPSAIAGKHVPPSSDDDAESDHEENSTEGDEK